VIFQAGYLPPAVAYWFVVCFHLGLFFLKALPDQLGYLEEQRNDISKTISWQN